MDANLLLTWLRFWMNLHDSHEPHDSLIMTTDDNEMFPDKMPFAILYVFVLAVLL